MAEPPLFYRNDTIRGITIQERRLCRRTPKRVLLFAPAMDGFIEVADVADVPIGRVKKYLVGERVIALSHTAEGFFATDNTCPHRGGPLDEGDLMGNEIVCPWHLWGFDVASGVCTGNPEISIRTHETRVEGERVMVRLR